MMTAKDVTRLQTAVGQQQAGNNILGAIGLKGGFACNSSGQVIAGSVTGPFVVVPDSSGTVGAFRAYPQAFGTPVGNPQSGHSTPAFAPYTGAQGTITSIDNVQVGGFTPRGPGVSETTIAQVTGFAIDTANNQYYITIQQATFSGALQGSLPSKFVVGIQCAVTLSSNANPL